MITSLALPPSSMRDLLPRLQAVLTGCILTGQSARFRVSGAGALTARAAEVEMPFTAAEVEMLVEAVARAASDTDFNEVRS